MIKGINDNHSSIIIVSLLIVFVGQYVMILIISCLLPLGLGLISRFLFLHSLGIVSDEYSYSLLLFGVGFYRVSLSVSYIAPLSYPYSSVYPIIVML